jgi:methionine-rich copper-binding protein CopC
VKRSLAALYVCVVVMAGVAPAVRAHAILLHASPAPKGTVSGPELKVELKFNSRIDAKRSRVTIVMPDKSTKALAHETSSSADTLSARGHGFAPGEYRLKWQVLSSDGHITRGEHPFTVK